MCWRGSTSDAEGVDVSPVSPPLRVNTEGGGSGWGGDDGGPEEAREAVPAQAGHMEWLERCGGDVSRLSCCLACAGRFLAGGPEDCLKHTVLILLLRYMVADAEPFSYVDAHAGCGLYDLDSKEAQHFCNFKDGARLLMAETGGSIEIRQLRASLKRWNRAMGGSGDRFYLGSPCWALEFLRPQDSAMLFESSLPVATELRSWVDRATVYEENSYERLLRDPPKLNRKKLILLDPPYDSATSYFTWNLFMLRELYGRWPEATIALWFPCYSDQQTENFLRRVAELHLGKARQQLGVSDSQVLVAQLLLERSPRQLPGSGMLILSPAATKLQARGEFMALSCWRGRIAASAA